MTLRTMSLFIAGAFLAIGISCKSDTATTNTNATAAPNATKSNCCTGEKQADVNASATPVKKDCCEKMNAEECKEKMKSCPAMKECEDKAKPENQ